jgi:hypothetical protein
MHAVGLNKTSYQPGNMLRFQLLFRLTSSLDPNYLHIHRVKGIIQASTVRCPCLLERLCMILALLPLFSWGCQECLMRLSVLC